MATTTHSITLGGKDRVEKATKLFSKAFENDAPITYMMGNLTGEKRLAYLPSYFTKVLTAAALNNAVFEEANDWEACAVWILPGYRPDNPYTLLPSGLLGLLWNVGVTGCSRLFMEFEPLSNAAKAKVLQKGEKYYYLFFTATRQDSRGKGLCSALVRRYQAIAAAEQLPIWLESGTGHSRNLYSHLGFKIVDEIILGKGKAGPDGTELKGGDGVKVWTMIWRQES